MKSQRAVMALIVAALTLSENSYAHDATDNDFAKSLIGREVFHRKEGVAKNLDGCTKYSSSLADITEEPRILRVYSYACHKRIIALLLKLTSKDTANVVDAVVLPPQSKNISYNPFNLDYYCSFLTQPPPFSFIIVIKKNRHPKLTAQNGGIINAWQVNPETEKFEPYPLKKITCEESPDP